ncbi:MAG TPA: hypothetical protein VHZ25_11015 [Acidobacteriaceae bacterium]|nr:hypothetical protein [Acidobacteriaceae bacterium]
MHFSALERLFWALGSALNLALVVVILVRGRWRQFPVLLTWLAFLSARTILLFTFYLLQSRFWYTRVYMTGLVVDFALQLGVIFEIARIGLRPTGTWVRGARAYFLAAGVAGVVVAALFAWYVSPPHLTMRRVWEIRANLFTSLVICELFVVMSLTATRLGLGWRNHVMAVGQTLTAWSAVMVVKTALQSFFGTQYLYVQLEQVRELTYAAAACWLMLQLWRDEPERRPISPDLHEYILALHRRVEYDLRRLDAQR